MTVYFHQHREWEEDRAAHRLAALESSPAVRGCLGLIARPLRPLLIRTIGQSFPGIVGRMAGAYGRGEFDEAITIALSGAERFRSVDPGHFFTRAEAFWQLLYQATSIATAKPEADWTPILQHARAPLEPIDGFDAARANYYVSRHLAGRGEGQGAADFARTSLKADPSWPESRVWAAWLGLTDPSFDTARLLREAIALDASTRGRLRRNPAFAGYEGLEQILADDAEGPVIGSTPA